MVTFYKLGSYGRLGNQFFQYAALKNLALKNNYKIKIFNLAELNSWHEQKCLLEEFNLQEENMNFSEIQNIKNFYEEPQERDESFFALPDNTNINGFFQDKFYFEDVINQLKNIYKLKREHIDIANEKLDKIKKYRKNNSLTSVHIRLGDMLKENYSFYSKNNFKENIRQYLNQSINYLGKENDFFIFTGGSRCASGQEKEDIQTCKELLNGLDMNFIFSENNDTLIDFQLMRMCDKHILSPLSTYSLWVGYLADENNLVLVPKDYYLHTQKDKDSKNLYLNKWIKI